MFSPRDNAAASVMRERIARRPHKSSTDNSSQLPAGLSEGADFMSDGSSRGEASAYAAMEARANGVPLAHPRISSPLREYHGGEVLNARAASLGESSEVKLDWAAIGASFPNADASKILQDLTSFRAELVGKQRRYEERLEDHNRIAAAQRADLALQLDKMLIRLEGRIDRATEDNMMRWAGCQELLSTLANTHGLRFSETALGKSSSGLGSASQDRLIGAPHAPVISESLATITTDRTDLSPISNNPLSPKTGKPMIVIRSEPNLDDEEHKPAPSEERPSKSEKQDQVKTASTSQRKSEDGGGFLNMVKHAFVRGLTKESVQTEGQDRPQIRLAMSKESSWMDKDSSVLTQRMGKQWKAVKGSVDAVQKQFYTGEDTVSSDILCHIAFSPKFNAFCIFMAILNAVMCGLQADSEVSRAYEIFVDGTAESEEIYLKSYFWFQVVFTAWLGIEFLINLAAMKWWFILGQTWKWNIFDVVVFLLSSLELGLASGNKFSAWKVLRVLRLGKVMQAFRFVKFFHGLQKMIVSLAACIVTLLWAFFLMFLLMYVFSILFLHGVTIYFEDQARAETSPRLLKAGVFSGGGGDDDIEELHYLYGSFGKSVLTLFRAVSGGDWGGFAAAINQASWVYGFLWTVYIGFMVFGVLNILTGIFVDSAIKAAESDCSIAVAEQIEREEELLTIVSTVFTALDSDGSQELSRSEFEKLLDNEKILAHLSSIGIETRRAKDLFELLDEDRSGYLKLEEVVNGLMQMQGDAKAVEILGMRQDIRRLQRHLMHVERGLGLGTQSVRYPSRRQARSVVPSSPSTSVQEPSQSGASTVRINMTGGTEPRVQHPIPTTPSSRGEVLGRRPEDTQV